MSIEEFHSYAVDFDEFKKRVDVYIEMMQIADVRFYVQHMSEEMMQHKDEVSEIIKKFKNAGIYFCVENEFVFERFSAYNINFEVMDKILETFPDAKVCLDIGHAFMVGIEPYEYYKRYKDKLKVIHLHDFKDGKDHLVPFTGELLQSPIVPELKKFKGPIVIELSMPALELLKDKYGEAMNMLSKHLLK